MKIHIEKITYPDIGVVWRADCKDLPGTPPVGRGDTPQAAVAVLFANLILEKQKSDWIGILARSLDGNPRVEVIEGGT